MSPIRVLLVDDHPVVRSGIQSLLEKVVDIEIVGEASTGEEALHMLEETNPDVLLLDMELPDIQGVQVAKQIQELHPRVKILALSAYDDPYYVKALLDLGASGYLMKEEAPEMIIDAIRGVARGERGWFSRNITAQIASWLQTNDNEALKLTPREGEVLRLVVQGKTNQGIAADLEISEKTVEKYMGAIFVKMNVSSRVEAAVQAVREGLM
jgi:DNA-binding NarL/FixJ family response regulator